MERLYQFVAIIPWGGEEERVVDLHYLPAEVAGVANDTQRHIAPYFTVSGERYGEIKAAAPRGVKNSPFRIVKERTRSADLEWST